MNKIKREEREDLHTFSDTTSIQVYIGYLKPYKSFYMKLAA